MGELSASNCGCNQPGGYSDCGGSGGCSNLIWLLVILSCCGSGSGLFNNNGNGSCSSGCGNWIWILILLSCCGGLGSPFSNGCGC